MNRFLAAAAAAAATALACWAAPAQAQSGAPAPTLAEAVYVSGQLLRVAQNPDARHYANFHLYLPDPRLTRSVANALALLRAACQQRSRFD